MNYYNENDAKAAAWLRELIKAGHIAQGEVDERSIVDVPAADLAGYIQCHFFAGIGGWSYALRLAGWPDDKPVWTGSCPCQPFSAAGKGVGFADERHLWPAWHWLIAQCRPSIIFGEQVGAAIRHGGLDLVQADLEACGYAFGAAGLPAACVGAPHLRDRLWFVAAPEGERWARRQDDQNEGRRQFASGRNGTTGESADSMSARRPEGWSITGSGQATGSGASGAVGHAHQQGSQGLVIGRDGADQRATGPSGVADFWANAEWIACRDGKARPVEPGTFPLAYGLPARVGRLRGYGNAIVPQVAAEFIRAVA